MTLSLLDEITQQQHRITQMRRVIALEEVALRRLEAARLHCKHEWLPAVRNYEHEGKACKLCGINDMYAETLMKLANQDN